MSDSSSSPPSGSESSVDSSSEESSYEQGHQNLTNSPESWVQQKVLQTNSDVEDNKPSSDSEWEENASPLSARRSFRSKKELLRSNAEEDSDYSGGNSRARSSKKITTLSESSSDGSDSDFEQAPTWGRSKPRFAAKAAAKPKQLFGGRRNNQRKRKNSPVSGSESSDGSFSSSDGGGSNQQTRSSRTTRTTVAKISYKDYESGQETDPEDVVETNYQQGEVGYVEEDDNTNKIDLIMDRRFGRAGATGPQTIAYQVRLHGDPNDGFDANQEPEEKQYLIKWMGSSHLHNTWEAEESLREANVRGMKRLENFKKKRLVIDQWVKHASIEDQEYYFCRQEVNRNVLENYRTVERVFARSAGHNEHGRYDYRCKWVGLPYIDSTWEDEILLKDFQNHINEFSMRQESPCFPRKESLVIRRRPNFVEMTQQPEWLRGKLKLRDYQLDGVNWLSRSWCRGNSVILADEMGLGKTIQTISFLSYLYHYHELYGLFLCVVPLSTMTAWQQEFQTWAPFMNVIIYMGGQDSRATIREVEWKFPNGHFKFNVVITSYEILLKDKTFLGSHSWSVIAVDEAHRLKNDTSLLYKSLKEFRSNFRVLITGTPMQNSLKELWALLHFIMPNKFDSWPRFEGEHAAKKEVGYTSLHKAVQPYLLRRVKKDVEKSLPQKVEKILRVSMAQKQKQYYKWILTRNYAQLRKGQNGGGSCSSFCNIVMELKKCCNHAYLIKRPESLENFDKETQLQDLLKSSGKMILLDKLLIRLKRDGHRVLIFSQMVQMLDVIQDYLLMRRLQFQRLDGSVDSASRRRALDHFNADGSEDFCFLLSTRAGGLGINLATADTVIIFDSDWNPMNDLQAQARAHRIGQKNQVHIYRLVCAGSVEENIVERAKQKMVLDHLVIQRMNTSGKTALLKQSASSRTTTNPFNKEELNAILQFGAEDIFAETENDEKDPECDIDDILSRAETRQESASTAYDELLSGFKVSTLTIDVEEPMKDWDNIIPANERKRIEEEDRLKKEKELYLPPRKRNKLKKSLNENDDDSEVDGSDTVSNDNDYEENNQTTRRRGKSARGSLREWDDYVKGFTVLEVRKFIRSFRKFGDPLTRLDAIARDAELHEQSEADLKRLGQALYDRLQAMNNNIKSSQDRPEESSKRGRGPSFRLAGVSVSVKTTLACIESLKPLSDVIPMDSDARKNFQLKFPVRPISTWHCKWNIEDDSKLLVGIYEYGMGNWDQIQSDVSLCLGSKILRPNKEKPQIPQLKSRSENLLKMLAKHQLKNPTQKTKTSQASSSRSKRAASRRDTADSYRINEATTVTSDKKARAKRRRGPRAKVTKLEEETSNKNNQTFSNDITATNNTSSPTSTPAAVSTQQQQQHSNELTSHEKKSRKNKRKHNDKDPTIEDDKEGLRSKKGKKKKTEDQKSNLSSSLPTISNVLLIGNTVKVIQLTREDQPKKFNTCKELLRPCKKSLRKLESAPGVFSGEKREKMKECILQIGDRIIECLRSMKDEQKRVEARTDLWNFLANFVDYNADKILKFYKSSVEKRDGVKDTTKRPRIEGSADTSSNSRDSHTNNRKDKNKSNTFNEHRIDRSHQNHHQDEQQRDSWNRNNHRGQHPQPNQHRGGGDDYWQGGGGVDSYQQRNCRRGTSPHDVRSQRTSYDYQQPIRGGPSDYERNRRDYRRTPPPPREYYHHRGGAIGMPPNYPPQYPSGSGHQHYPQGVYHPQGPPPSNYDQHHWRHQGGGPPPGGRPGYPPPPNRGGPYGPPTGGPYGDSSSSAGYNSKVKNSESTSAESIRRTEKT